MKEQWYEKGFWKGKWFERGVWALWGILGILWFLWHPSALLFALAFLVLGIFRAYGKALFLRMNANMKARIERLKAEIKAECEAEKLEEELAAKRRWPELAAKGREGLGS